MRDNSMGAASAESRRGCAAIGRRRNAVRITIERDGWNLNRGLRRQAALQIGITRIAGGEPVAVTIAVDHDVDIIGIIEGRRGPVEGRIVEMPARRPLLP